MNVETEATEAVAPVTETPATSGESQTEAPAQAAEKPEAGAAQEAEGGEKGEKPGQPRKPIAPRISELTRAQREAERERDYWRSRAEAREAKEAAEAKAAADKRPVPADFESYDDYVEKLAEWIADKRVDDKLTKREQEAQRREQDRARQSTFAERVEAARKEIPDFDAVMETADMRVSDHVAEILQESEYGPRLGHHFALHPEALERINAMSATAAAREIGRIEAGFEKAAPAATATEQRSDDSPEPEKTPPKRTAAPPPAKPLGTSRSTEPTLQNADMDSYKKIRKSQGARWAR